ncbi:MAG: ImmA/IrrE family metallo-endopeptidase [Rhodospirillaceae bacterium]
MQSETAIAPDLSAPIDLDPIPSHLSKEEVADLAEELAGILDFAPGDDLEPIVQWLGGTIHEVDDIAFSSGVNGTIEVNGYQDFTINVPKNTYDARQRFTIAHEIGHYVLHAPLKDGHRLVARRYDSGRTEWEANWFASSFLMPTKTFTERFQLNKGDLVATANQFKVSLEAATYRAKNLNLL